jgi:hypothetical protein
LLLVNATEPLSGAADPGHPEPASVAVSARERRRLIRPGHFFLDATVCTMGQLRLARRRGVLHRSCLTFFTEVRDTGKAV